MYCVYSDRTHNLDNSVFIHPVKFLEECLAPPLLWRLYRVNCPISPFIMFVFHGDAWGQMQFLLSFPERDYCVRQSLPQSLNPSSPTFS